MVFKALTVAMISKVRVKIAKRGDPRTGLGHLKVSYQNDEEPAIFPEERGEGVE